MIGAHQHKAGFNTLLLSYSALSAAAAFKSTMPIKLGDIVKLYKKNIHVSAQTKHFKELADGDFVLVRVKNIEHRGEHRQRKLTATVTWPARLQDGQPIVY